MNSIFRRLTKHKFIYDEDSEIVGVMQVEEVEEVFVVEARKFVKDVSELENFEKELKEKGFIVEKRCIVFEY